MKKNDTIKNSDNIQLYVEDFVDQLCKNPHFTNEQIRGAPPKVINQIFISGLTPPVFRAIVKDLGTTDIETTIRKLPEIYSELEIHLRWKKRCAETDCEQPSDIDKSNGNKKRIKEFSGKATHCSHCLLTHPAIARSHTDDTCYFLHPEQMPDWKKDYENRKVEKEVQKPTKVGYAAIKTDVKETDEEMANMRNMINFLNSQLAIKDAGEEDI